MSGTESQLWVNTLLRGRQVVEFLAVKEHLGIQNNTGVVRHLIHKQAQAIRRRSRSRPSPSDPAPAPLGSAPLDQEGHEAAGLPAGQSPDSPEVWSLCFSCSLPECDETDPGCRYQQATGRRQIRCERMRAYSRRAYSRRTGVVRRTPSVRRTALTPDGEA